MGAYYGLGLGLGGAPSLVRGGHVIGSPGYVRDGLVANWSSSITENSLSLADRSSKNNDASLLTGRYITTDGIDDKAINATIGDQFSGTFRGWVRPRGDEVFIYNAESEAVTFSSLIPNVWQYVETETNTFQGTTVLGWDGQSSYSDADWSDWEAVSKDISGNDIETIAHWRLNESNDSDLNGYPALDSSGNGLHGTHTGCAGGTGEGTDSALLKSAFTKNFDKTHFRGDVTNFVRFSPIPTIIDGYIEAKVVANPKQVGSKFLLIKDGGSTTNYLFAAQSGSSSAPASGVGTSYTITVDGSPVTTRGALYDALTDGNIHTLKAEGISTTFWSSGFIELNNYTGWGFNGLIYDLDINNQFFFPNEDGTWIDTKAGGTNITVSGLATVEQSAASIPQSAAINWNKTPLPAPLTGDILVPERDALDGVDAYGTAITQPRQSSDTLNLFGDGEYADIVSSDSLNLGAEATWEVWGNLYGVRQEYYIVKHAQYAIGRETSQPADGIRVTFGNVAALNQFTGLTDSFGCLQIVFDAGMLYGYWNGQSMTKTYLAGTLPATLAGFANTKDVNIGAFEGVTPVAFTNNQLAGAKIYSKALTAEEALKNYNAQKFKYGIV